jgi:hypothetical protein
MAEEEAASASELADSLEENIPGEAMGDLTEADTQLEQSQSSGISTNVEAAEANVEAAQKPVLDGLAKAAGIPDVPITEDLVNEASGPNPEGAAKALKEKVIEPSLDKAKENIENAQEANGESGKPLKDSPKTKMELLKKYGPAGLKLLLAIAVIGFGIYELDKIAAEMSGCYRFSTNTAGTPEKIGCPEATCSCQNIAQCGSNNTPCTQANGLQYMWRKFSALDALCQLPKMVLDPIASGLSDLLKPLKQIVVGVLIVAVVLFILYVIYKNLNKKISH